MATKRRFCGIVIIGTIAEINAITHIYEAGTQFIATDKTIIKIGDGVHAPAALKTRQSTLVAAAAAVPATFADLAAARTAVNTLNTQVEAIRVALVTAGLMSAT
jgi:hypothetical protein